MAADVTKNVVVKVGVQGPAGADPLKAVAANARQSDEALRKMGDSGKRSLDQMKASADRAKGSLDKLKGAGSGLGGVGGAGQGSGMLGGAAAGFGALRLGAAAGIGLKAGAAIFNDAKLFGEQAQDPEYGGPSPHSIQRARVNQLDRWWIPEGSRQKVGKWAHGEDFDYDQASQDVKERDRRVAERRAILQRDEQRAALLDPLRQRQDALKEQAAAMTDRTTMGMDAEAQKRQLAGMLQGQSSAAQAVARASGDDPADVRARFQFQEQALRMQVDQNTQLKMLDQARGRAQEDVAEKQAAVAASVKQEEAARRNLAVAGLSGEQRLERSLSLEAQIAETMRKQKQLQEARNQALTLEQSKLDTIVAQHQQKVGLLEQERDRQRGIAESEADKLSGGKASFGLLELWQQRGLEKISETMAAGGKLAPEQISAIQGRPEFQDKLREYALARANESGIFDRVVGNLGADKKMRDAEQAAVKIQNQIDVTVKMDSRTIVEQLVEILSPAIAQAMAEARNAAATALSRSTMFRRADQGANAGPK